MMIGRALYSQDDGLKIAIAPTVAYKRKMCYIRNWLADGHNRKVIQAYDNAPHVISGFSHFPICSITSLSRPHS
jgi:hypothetical protein